MQPPILTGIDPEKIDPTVALPPEVYTKIGRLVVAWNQLDFQVDVCVSAIMKVEMQTAEIFMATTAQRARLAIFDEAANSQLPPDLRDMALFIKGRITQTLIDERNGVVHGKWVPSLNGGWALYSKLHKDPLFHFAKIEEHIAEVRSIIADLNTLFVKLIEHGYGPRLYQPRTSPGKSGAKPHRGPTAPRPPRKDKRGPRGSSPL
jgi:hypothetical protein